MIWTVANKSNKSTAVVDFELSADMAWLKIVLNKSVVRESNGREWFISANGKLNS